MRFSLIYKAQTTGASREGDPIGDMAHDDRRRAIDVETIGFFVAAKAALPRYRTSARWAADRS